MIERQNEQNRVLLPFLAQMEGFNVNLDDRGNIISISQIDDPSKGRQRRIQELLEERSIAALEGRLPVDPTLEAALGTEEENLRNRLIAQFGPGYETSSPGIETLGNFFSQAEQLRYGARTGQLTLAEQLGLTRAQQDIFGRQSSMDVLRTNAVGDPLQFAGAYGQVARGFGQAQVPFIQNRGMQLQASLANRQQNMALVGAGIGALGSIGSMFSDRDIKGDPIRIGETIHGIPIYVYTRLDDGEQYIGVMADEVEPILPGAIYTKEGYDMVQYRDLE